MKMLFVIPLIALAALVSASGPATAPAGAAPACQGQFDLLRTGTETVVITGGKVDKERAGLLRLVEDAEALVAQGKTADAITKLGNLEVKVDQLEAAGRISPESATQLRGDAEATIACLGSSSA